MSGTPGLAATAIVNPVEAPMGLPPMIEPVVQPPHDVHQPNRIHIEHRRRIRIIAQLGRIAGEAKNILQPDRRRAQQIALDAQHIAVAAGVVQQRLDAGLLLNLDAQALRAHARRRARRVGDIDGVDPDLPSIRGALQLLARSRCPWAARSPPW